MAEDTVKVLDMPPPGEENYSQMETPVVREISLSEDRQTALKSYLEDEIRRAIGDRGQFDANLVRWQEAYDAPRNEDAKDFPFAGAADITVPVIKETVNTLVSQLTQSILTPTPRWTVKTDNAGWKTFAGTIERFLDRAAREDMKMDKNLETWILEATKYGTSVLQVTYERITKDVMMFSRDGSKSWPETRPVREGPTVYNVPLQDFLIPFSSTDIQDARWVAKRFRLNAVELEQRAKAGIYKNVSQVLIGREPTGIADETGDLLQDEPVLEAHEDLQDAVPTIRDTYEIFEWWGAWAPKEGGPTYEIRAYYHLRTNTLLRVEYNPYWHGKRPFVALVYFPVEYRFYGQGLCEQLEQLQEEITAVHNQRLDNATLANTRAVLVRRLSQALKPGDPIYAGQIIEVTEPDDVTPFQLGEVYPSTIQNEQIARSYVDNLSGISDAQRGGMPVTRTTASAQAGLLAEQAKRFDQTIRKIRGGLKEIADFIFLYYFQFGVEPSKPVQWLGNKGKAINAIFSLPYKTVDMGLGFEASAPTSQLNKEAQRQQYLAVFNLLVQLYDKFFLLLQNIGAPPDLLAVIAGSMASTAKDYLWQVLERFDVQNPDEALATLNVIMQVLPSPEDLGGNEDIERRLEDTKILDQIQELENTLRAAAGAEEGNLRVVSP